MKLDVVIFTKNREELIDSTINYYLENNCNVAVLDGSDRERRDLIKNTAIKKETEYYYLPGSSVWQRLQFVEKIVKAENFLLSPDDDLISISVIRQHVHK